MILFFDENLGTKIPSALRGVGLRNVKWFNRAFPTGAEDEVWLEKAGQNGWLVISGNKHMLDVPHERDVIVREKVGIVVLMGEQAKSPDVLALLLRKQKWLEQINAETEKPFAFYLFPSGRTKRVL